MELVFTNADNTMEVIPSTYRVSFLIKSNGEKKETRSVFLEKTDIIFLKGFLERILLEYMERKEQ